MLFFGKVLRSISLLRVSKSLTKLLCPSDRDLVLCTQNMPMTSGGDWKDRLVLEPP